jgi:hypothetical protein
VSDITITTAQLKALAPALAGILQLSPPPTAKGRYALAKAGAKVDPAYKLFGEQDSALAARVAVKDKDGNPIIRDMGNGLAGFDVRPDAKEEYQAEMKALLEEEVVLSGVRQITHAELGACPITAQQEMVLIDCGLLEDKEPA